MVAGIGGEGRQRGDRGVDEAGPGAGVVAVIEVGELTVKPVAGSDPKWTTVAPAKPVPVMVTTVPPSCSPRWG